MKTTVIDTGGGLRGIYGAGVLDRCIEKGISFDRCIGVSAGSANTASFLAGQHGRNFRFYTQYAKRTDYMSASNILKKHSYLDLDYIYGVLSNSDGEDPLDYDALMKNPTEYTVVATDAESGEPFYFSKADMRQNDYGILKASCCIPIACKAYTVGEKQYYDGGVSDAIPIEYALDAGADRIVLILTRPIDADVSFDKERICSVLLKSKYPNVSEALLKRGERFHNSIELAKKLEKDGRLIIIAPSDIGHLKTLTKDIGDLTALYERGKQDAELIKDFL